MPCRRVDVIAVIAVVAAIAVAAVGLVGTSLPAAAAPPASGLGDPPVERGTKGDPGPLASQPRDFAAEFPATPADGDADARGGGQRPDVQRVREVVERRTESTETFLPEDGSFETEVSAVPTWYRDATGGWAKVDHRVVDDPDREGGLRSMGAGWSVRLGWASHRRTSAKRTSTEVTTCETTRLD